MGCLIVLQLGEKHWFLIRSFLELSTVLGGNENRFARVSFNHDLYEITLGVV